MLMKKHKYILTLVAVLMTCLLLSTGCKKHTCECITHNVSPPDLSGRSDYIVRGTKKKQKELCTDKSTQPDSGGNYTSCVLK